ncbi:MAG: hypothetical protein IKR64_06110 [Treponema sp.]|nr:hypothetical protein [Treponema sp.]
MKTLDEFIEQVEKTLTPETLSFYKENGGRKDKTAAAILNKAYKSYSDFGAPIGKAISNASSSLTMEF